MKYCDHNFDLYQPHVTLTFDLLTHKVDRFISLLWTPFVPICSRINSSL